MYQIQASYEPSLITYRDRETCVIMTAKRFSITKMVPVKDLETGSELGTLYSKEVFSEDPGFCQGIGLSLAEWQLSAIEQAVADGHLSEPAASCLSMLVEEPWLEGGAK